jgi:hypothetical protein
MRLRNLSTHIDPGFGGEPSICEACGATFSCGAHLSTSCWCAEVKLGEAARTEMRASSERCLCRACLERFAEHEKGAVEESNG